LTDVGFNGYHLSQIVRNAGWEEKLSLIISSTGIQLALKKGKITHNKLAKMLKNKNWRQFVQAV